VQSQINSVLQLKLEKVINQDDEKAVINNNSNVLQITFEDGWGGNKCVDLYKYFKFLSK
jgi:hypothetical protein